MKNLIRRIMRRLWGWSTPKDHIIHFDLPNLLIMFNESIEKIIEHLEHGRYDKALIRARKTHTALGKVIGYCVSDYHNEIERRL